VLLLFIVFHIEGGNKTLAGSIYMVIYSHFPSLWSFPASYVPIALKVNEGIGLLFDSVNWSGVFWTIVVGVPLRRRNNIPTTMPKR
jgi:hypothetical protein